MLVSVIESLILAEKIKLYLRLYFLGLVLAALRGDKTIAELCQAFDVASSQIYAWKKDLEERGSEIFETRSPESSHRAEVDKLHGVIGKLEVELEGILQISPRRAV